MSKIISALNISASALTAQKAKMEVISQNIANAETVQTENSEPYSRRVVTLEAVNSNKSFDTYLNDKINGDEVSPGVRISTVDADESPFKLVYEPDSPYADEYGYVRMSNVDTTQEMLELLNATRAYEANVTALNATKGMLMKALEIGK